MNRHIADLSHFGKNSETLPIRFRTRDRQRRTLSLQKTRAEPSASGRARAGVTTDEDRSHASANQRRSSKLQGLPQDWGGRPAPSVDACPGNGRIHDFPLRSRVDATQHPKSCGSPRACLRFTSPASTVQVILWNFQAAPGNSSYPVFWNLPPPGRAASAVWGVRSHSADTHRGLSASPRRGGQNARQHQRQKTVGRARFPQPAGRGNARHCQNLSQSVRTLRHLDSNQLRQTRRMSGHKSKPH
jgi:hypothetical protein